MNNYDDFISQVGAVSQIPSSTYSKIRFRIAVQKAALPTALAIPVFCIFAAVFMLNGLQDEQDYDLTANAEEILFAQTDNYYSLFYEGW
jgi:hypothetical protein